MPLFDSASTFSQHEESLRVLGELLGFNSTRPEQEDDSDTTLDVLWMDNEDKKAILFENKTKKKLQNPLNTDDVGQGHIHLTWFKTLHPTITPLGLIFVAAGDGLSKQAAPSDLMWINSPMAIKTFFDEIMQTLLALARMAPLDRYVEIASMCERAEWKVEGIFERVRGKRL